MTASSSRYTGRGRGPFVSPRKSRIASIRFAGVEARGFLLAAPVAYRLGASLLPIRKPGKLPWEVVEQPYELEYGVDAVQAHRDAAQAVLGAIG